MGVGQLGAIFLRAELRLLQEGPGRRERRILENREDVGAVERVEIVIETLQRQRAAEATVVAVGQRDVRRLVEGRLARRRALDRGGGTAGLGIPEDRPIIAVRRALEQVPPRTYPLVRSRPHATLADTA